jgi:hypothetical protein
MAGEENERVSIRKLWSVDVREDAQASLQAHAQSGFLNEKRNFSGTEGVYMSSTTRCRRVTFGVRRVVRLLSTYFPL